VTALSAVILAADAAVPVSPSPEALVRTLSALVPAAIEGLVRSVVIAGLSGNNDMHSVAEHAGCDIAESDTASGIIGAGLSQARGDHLLILKVGYAPDRAALEDLSDIAGDLGRLRAMRLRAAPETFLTRLLPFMSPTVGLVAVRSALPKGAPDLQALVRAARPSGSLRTRLRRVG
jgi:hypothetical protein